MAIVDRGRVTDAITSLEGGMDSGRSPSLIEKNQVFYAQNVTFRGGFARTRAGFRRAKLNSSAAATALKDDKFQGSHYYQHSDGSGSMIAVAGGNVYKISANGSNWDVTDITNSVTLSSTVSRVHFLQAENYLIIQDGSNRAWIWDGSGGATASDASTKQVPVGTAMAYGNGRIWVANGRTLTAGDILNLVTGEAGTASILTFTENDYLAGGGSFTVPVGTSDITSLEFISAPNTALGHGELIVFTADAVTSVRVPVDRNDWFALQDPIQKVILINNGAVGDHTVEHVSGDLYFRSRDGIRSLIMAVRDQSQYGNTPISREMARILKYDNPTYFAETSSVLFNNRYLCTALPVNDESRGVAYKGLVALDYDLVGGLKGKLPMAYDGFWSLDVTRNSSDYTLQFLQLAVGNFSGTERCFAMVRNESMDTEMWELRLDTDEIFDVDLDSSGNALNQKITAQIETPSFNFGTPGSAKELESADIWMDELTGGTISFDVDFHPDQYPCWIDWQNWDVIAEYTASSCESFVDAQVQYRPRMRIGRPIDDAEPAVDKRFNMGWEFAARIKWKGQGRLKLLRLNARTIQEEPYADVLIDGASKVIACDCLSGVSSATNK
tara:strand:- start:5125 stop:6960 length:1836 start_codon:yes stop_codon:yes gene_type:complete